MGLKENLDEVLENVGGRATLIAVTKTVGADAVRSLIGLGIRQFGENRLESESKIMDLNNSYEDIKWHMIGTLQSNKIRKVVELFDMIHSVDSIKHVRLIDKESGKIGKRMDILIQVNIGEESQKSGLLPGDVENFFSELSGMGLKNINTVGMMCIAPFVEAEKTRLYFRKMKELYDSFKEKYGLKTLSMGMTNDYLVAINEGSTMIRVGTALFR